MGVAIKKSSIDLGIVTTNGAAMLAFYRDTLGFTYERQIPMPVGDGIMHRMYCGESLIKLVVLPAAPAKSAPGGIGGATGYLGAELAALVQEHCFYHLEAPIERVTGWDTPYPHAQEWAYFPGPGRVAAAFRRALEP